MQNINWEELWTFKISNLWKYKYVRYFGQAIIILQTLKYYLQIYKNILSYCSMLLECYCWKITKVSHCHVLPFHWTMNFYLSHMCISSILMIACYSNLNHKHTYWSITNIFYWNVHPTLNKKLEFLNKSHIKFKKKVPEGSARVITSISWRSLKWVPTRMDIRLGV